MDNLVQTSKCHKNCSLVTSLKWQSFTGTQLSQEFLKKGSCEIQLWVQVTDPSCFGQVVFGLFGLFGGRPSVRGVLILTLFTPFSIARHFMRINTYCTLPHNTPPYPNSILHKSHTSIYLYILSQPRKEDIRTAPVYVSTSNLLSYLMIVYPTIPYFTIPTYPNLYLFYQK